MRDSSEDEVTGSEHGDVAEVEEYSDLPRGEDQSVQGGSANDIPSGYNEEPLGYSQNASLNKSAEDSLSSDDLTSTLQKTRDEDRKKGRAISKQIVRFLAFVQRYFVD